MHYNPLIQNQQPQTRIRRQNQEEEEEEEGIEAEAGAIQKLHQAATHRLHQKGKQAKPKRGKESTIIDQIVYFRFFKFNELSLFYNHII